MPAVLVAEDDETIRGLLVMAFCLHDGWVATGVEDGAKLLAAIDAIQPDLITLDVNMPGLDGIEIYRLLRERDATARVPVLFVTVAADQVRRARLNGVHDTLAKPFSLDDLLARAAALLPR